MSSRHQAWLLAMLATACINAPATAAPGTTQKTDLVAAQSEAPTAALIKANLKQRLANLPAIDQVSATPMDGLYEVRIDRQVFYTDAQGNFLVRGELIDTRSLRNLTEERVNKLSAIDFAKLPLKDAITWKSGTGQHKVAVFADPNCGYCKKLEQELQKVKDITVYTFVIPILGGDSAQKAQAIWCNKDATQVWRNWMLQGIQPEQAKSDCETPIERNGKLAQSFQINGTPAIFFEDGSRNPGFINASQISTKLVNK